MALSYSKLILLLGLVALIWSCQKEQAGSAPTFHVHEDFQQALDTFSHYASVFGVNLDLTNLIIEYADDLTFGTCGICNGQASNVGLQKSIKITQTQSCWNSHQELEALILHELGHCLLDRAHLADTLPNGDPKSLMVSSNLAIYAPCTYAFGEVDDCNNIHKRTYYLTELFNPDTPTPSWSLEN